MLDILKHLPLYKRKGREEVFLGIVKSKHKNWIGWQYITEIKNSETFAQDLIDLGIYELAMNFWELQRQSGKEVTFEILMKNYNI